MEAPLELVHVDLMTDLKGHANYHYALVAVDDFSSLIYMEPLCTKSAALTALRRWIARMEQAMDRKLKTLHSDNGGEWCSIAAEDWQTQEGFKWQKSVPGISVQNGQAERAIRSVQEKMRSMLIGRACPRELWLYAITAAAHMMNLTPSATKTIPHEAFYGTTAHKLAQQLRVFGCLAWVHVQQKDQQGKYRARAKPAIMIGRVMGSYGRSTGIEDLVDTSREHGRSAVSMETMDSYGLTCKGGPSTATRRTKLKEQAQPRGGPSSRSMQMVTTQGLERQEPKELSLIKGGGAVSKESTPGHEEEEQCRRT
ncbi:hypothetical protein NDA14_004873 [Ustilago hordei]|nr:hypothetical protein NDA14_004873 [Ustilago hordei]